MENTELANQQETLTNQAELDGLKDFDIYQIDKGVAPKPDNYDKWKELKNAPVATETTETVEETETTTTEETEVVENTETTETTQTPTFKDEDLDKFIATKFESKGYKNSKDIENIINDYEIKNKQLEAITPEYEELKKSADLLGSFTKDEDFKAILKTYQFSKDNNIKDFAFAMSVVNANPKDLKDIEVVLLAEKIENPDADIRDYEDIINNKYSTDKDFLAQKLKLGDNYEDLEDAEKRNVDSEARHNKYELNKLAATARKSIADVQGKIKVPEIKAIDNKVEQDKLIEQWQPKFKPFIDSIKEIKIKDIKLADFIKEPLTIDLPITDEADGLQKQLAEAISTYVIQNKVEPTEKNLQELKGFAEDVLWNMNREKFLQTYTKQVVKAVSEHYLNKIGNNNPERGTTNPPAKGNGKLTDWDKYQQQRKKV